MQPVSIDDANPQSGEETFILQLSVPSVPNADGGDLMDKIGQFAELYLKTAAPESARFARMGGNTWVIAASAEDANALEQARASLAEALYGSDDGTQVQLEWPAGVEPTGIELADEGAPSDDDWTLAESPEESVEPGKDSVALFEADEVDIADIETASFGHDSASDEAVSTPESVLVAGEGLSGAGGEEAEDEDVFVLDDLNIGYAEDVAEAISDVDIEHGSTTASEPSPDEDARSGPSGEFDVVTAAQRAAFDDDNDVFEVDAFDIEFVDRSEDDTPTDNFDVQAEPIEEAVADFASAIEEVAEEVGPIMSEPIEPEPFEDLTEAPDRPKRPDIAQELSNFRTEMRQIAASIPGASDGVMLAEFRAELDAISGAMGQRVDSAAQRIEAAASDIVEATARVNADRISQAADRAETSARQLEAGISEALSALNAAVKAMSAGDADAPASTAN